MISHPCECCGCKTKGKTLCFNCKQAEKSAPSPEQIAEGCAEVQQWPEWRNRQRLVNERSDAVETPYVRVEDIQNAR